MARAVLPEEVTFRKRSEWDEGMSQRTAARGVVQGGEADLRKTVLHPGVEGQGTLPVMSMGKWWGRGQELAEVRSCGAIKSSQGEDHKL